MEGEGVGHGMQHLDPGQVEAVDRGSDRDCPGPDDESVIAELPLAALADDGDLLAGGVDRAGGVVQEQLEAGLFQIPGGAVGQLPPVADVARQVVGQPADGEVGKASVTTTVASTAGSSSRARRPAAIPASLPPITSSRIVTVPESVRCRG